MQMKQHLILNLPLDYKIPEEIHKLSLYETVTLLEMGLNRIKISAAKNNTLKMETIENPHQMNKRRR